MELSKFTPIPTLVTQQTNVDRPRFPVIDAHNHLGGAFPGWEEKSVPELLDILDAAGVRGIVDLDGGWGEEILAGHLDRFKRAAPDRFRIFGGVNWGKWQEKGDRFVPWAVERLRAQASRGADGFKIHKSFGLKVLDHHGDLVAVDDERLDPLYETAAELGLPVTLHIADPVAFFSPLDGKNERWEELQTNPDWQFANPPGPPFLDLVNGMAKIVTRHPSTTFIGAHVGCYAENLPWVGELLDLCPNFYIDISARLAELGRQPYAARRFFIQYADRILFGTDTSADLETYRLHYRFLETADEYFPYDSSPVGCQGRWRIYGLFLPDDVLEKIYYKNAEKIIFNRKK